MSHNSALSRVSISEIPGQGFLRGLRRRGGQLVCDAEVRAVAQVSANWRVQAGGRTWQAPVLINAAGAWCDALAALAGIDPLGLQPKRRSAFTFAAPAGSGATGWPACMALDHSWYVKPDAAQLLGSPANEDPAPPQDVQPEELDIAVGVHRIEQATTLAVRPTRRWAGLRSFVPDGDIIGGFDSQAEGFFWLAGQGGFGIQTSRRWAWPARRWPQSVEAARKDGTLAILSRGGALPVKATGGSKTREQVQQEYLNMSAAEKQRNQELYGAGG